MCRPNDFYSKTQPVYVSRCQVSVDIQEQESHGKHLISYDLCEDPNFTLLAKRWYPSAIRIFDSSLLIFGGMHVEAMNSFEFFPRKEETTPFHFPGTLATYEHVSPVSSSSSSLFTTYPNLFTDSKWRCPTSKRILRPSFRNSDIPNGVRVTNPTDGSIIPDFIPEVLVCGNQTVVDDRIQAADLSSQIAANSQCSRLKATPAGIAEGRQIEIKYAPISNTRVLD